MRQTCSMLASIVADAFAITISPIDQHMMHTTTTTTAKWPHIAVCTPHAAKTLLQQHALDASRVRMLVVDELDTMVDDSFVDVVGNVLNQVLIVLLCCDFYNNSICSVAH